MAEDNAMNAKVQTLMLRALNCDVTSAANGRDAVELAAKARYDLILMDLHMPELGGLDASKQIRADPNGASMNAPIAALTASTTPEDKKSCLDAGMDDFLAKPVGIADLESLIRKCRTGELAR